MGLSRWTPLSTSAASVILVLWFHTYCTLCICVRHYCLGKFSTRQVVYYNVTLRRVRLTFVALEIQQALNIINMCAYSCRSCAACKVITGYNFSHLWTIWHYHIFPHYLIRGTIFGKRIVVRKNKCAFFFPP